MIAEADIPNPNLELIPGMYATVLLKVDRKSQVLTVPVLAIAGTSEPTVFVVNAEQKIEERPVKLGLETPTKYEVVSGVRPGEMVIIGSRGAVHVGEKVTPKVVDSFATP